jgi:prepilin-type N-terminal cleavage/methylation domain-containing protein
MKMLAKLRKNQKGFTLVEVIVVAVIVAVLALVAIMLYQGYTQDARRNTAENLAAAAAGYLQAEVNRGATGTVSLSGRNLVFGTPASGAGITATVFTVPVNATPSIGTDAIQMTIAGQTSASYQFR